METKRNYFSILIVILFLVPIGQIAIDLYTPSLPAIADAFHVSSSAVQLSITTYTFGFGIGQLISGVLSDYYGRKPIVLAGILLYVACSIMAVLSTSIWILLIARFFQGIGATAPSVISKSIATDSFEGDVLLHISTYIMIVWGVSPIVAPLLGGYLQHYFDWHANFYFMALYALISFILVFWFFTETLIHRIPIHPKIILANIVKILRHKEFIVGALGMSTMYSIVVAFLVFAPFLIQNHLGYSAITYGHGALLLGAGWLLGALCNRWLINTLSIYKIILVVSILNITINLVSLLISFVETTLSLILISSTAVVFFIGIIYPNYMALCMRAFPTMAGMGNAIMGFLVLCFSAIVTVIMTIFPTTSFIPLVSVYLILSLASLIIYKSLIRQAS